MLRTQKLGEADRIITLLTRSHGRVRPSPRGYGGRVPFGSRLEPFSQIDLQLPEARSLDVSPRRRRGPYGGSMGADYARYTAGTVMLETAERLVVEDKEPAPPAVPPARRCPSGRSRQTGPSRGAGPGRVPAWRSLAVAGYAPSFDACARCGTEGPHVAFNPSAGGMLCSGCRLPGSARPATETVAALAALLSGEWDVVPGDRRASPAGGQHPRGGLPGVAPRARAQVAHPPAAVTWPEPPSAWGWHPVDWVTLNWSSSRPNASRSASASRTGPPGAGRDGGRGCCRGSRGRSA